MRFPLARAFLAAAMPLALAAEEPKKAIPLLDVDAASPDEGALATIIENEVDPSVPLRGRVLSDNGQFGVSGGTPEARASLALQVEELRRDIHRLLGLDKEPVTMPIEIILYGKPGDPPRARALAKELRFTRQNYVLRLHLDLARGIDQERLRREVLAGLIDQQSLKGVEPGSLAVPLKVPVWLVEGVLEARRWRSGAGDRKLYEGVFRNEGRFTTDQILGMDEPGHDRLDGVSRDMFRVLSGALVMALLEQSEGRAALASLCGEVAKYEGEPPMLLRRHFPGLNLSRNSLEKWWALTLAKMADAPLTDAMTIAETERELERALVLRIEGDGLPKQVGFDARGEADALGEARRLAAIRPAQQALNRLSYRCFPSYRPLLVEYQELLARWASKGPDDQLGPRLLDLGETRAVMAERAQRARDYLDYIEIADAAELSGSFEDYLKLKRELAERPRAERNDPVSSYLDRMDRIYGPPSHQ
jgi:hypothetical protein